MLLRAHWAAGWPWWLPKSVPTPKWCYFIQSKSSALVNLVVEPSHLSYWPCSGCEPENFSSSERDQERGSQMGCPFQPPPELWPNLVVLPRPKLTLPHMGFPDQFIRAPLYQVEVELALHEFSTDFEELLLHVLKLQFLWKSSVGVNVT